MITIAICDDEPYFVSNLSKLIEEYGAARGIGVSILTFPTGEDLLSSGKRADIILMDIRLPGQDGMKIMGQLREHGNHSQVIFITSYPQYVFQAFDFDAIHYILKPATAEKLFPAMDKAVKRAGSDRGKTILITNGSAASNILIKDIVYCEAFNHQITIHTLTEQFQFFGTLDSVQGSLDERFFRCHRSYIVNMNYVADKEPGAATMADGGRILISRRKQQDFTQKLLDVCRKGLM
ncbi:LytTR family DNA-binding domain-containing protein [Lachnospiraceae bacterium 62-35]